MSELKNRISTLIQATGNWLRNDNHYLMDAIDRTAREGYFAFHDVKFALEAIEKSITRKSLEEWSRRAGLNNESSDAGGQNVMCLHAGNIPLVGFQDAFGTLLSGARYSGKISRQDPYLLPTFLNEIKKTELWSDRDVQWSHRLDDFEDMRNDAVVFAGSASSVPAVKDAIKRWNLATDKTRYLIRTAHFSMAYVDHVGEGPLKNLVESIFRYGGKGCRSVAVVVSALTLDEIKARLPDHIKSFWAKNPQYAKPSPKLKQHFAYNQAIERSQIWLNYFLLQQGGIEEVGQDFVCCWYQGDKHKMANLAHEFGDRLQSIFVTNRNVQIPGFCDKTELLSNAQQPPISWKPDNVDILKWLCREEVHV